MKFTSIILALMVGILVGAAGYRWLGARPIRAGTVWAVQWLEADGRSAGLTRGRFASDVPGGNGSAGIDMRGKLYRDHLELWFPAQSQRGPTIIPSARLVKIEFGESGSGHVVSSIGVSPP